MKDFQKNIPLSKHTYFKIGGPADLFAVANSTDELIEIVHHAQDNNIPFVVIGNGSNVLISDAGFRGLVIKNKSNKIQFKGFTGRVKRGRGLPADRRVDLKEIIVCVDSGVPANQLIRYTLDEGLAGLESFLGLPGTVGGAIYNNSHHLDKLIGDLVVEVTTLASTGEIVTLHPPDLKFAYDYSIFHDTKDTILTASFQLKRGDKDKLWEIGNVAVKRRATTQPLNKPSSGCIFRNISQADAMRIGLPADKAGNPTRSVGYLIDKIGLKGERVGGASVSDIHANFIVNDGSATASDILQLTQIIKDRVKSEYGVDLQEEIIIIGEVGE